MLSKTIDLKALGFKPPSLSIITETDFLKYLSQCCNNKHILAKEEISMVLWQLLVKMTNRLFKQTQEQNIS